MGPLQSVHDKHNLASPSPVTDGQLVYAWFGTGQIVALDMTGKLAWQRHLGREISPFDINWGHSSSPTLYQDTLILLCDPAPASDDSRKQRDQAVRFICSRHTSQSTTGGQS